MKINRIKLNSQFVKYIFGMMLLCLFLFSGSGYVYAEEAYQVTEMQLQGTITTDSALNVRSGPGKDYDVIGKVTGDTVLTITGQADNGWYQVELDGQTGFVSDKYVNTQEIADEEQVEMDKEAGEPEEGYRGWNQNPYVIKLAVIGVVIIVVLIMLMLTVKGLKKEEAEEDDGEDDQEDDDEDDDDGETGNDSYEEADEKAVTVRKSGRKKGAAKKHTSAGASSDRKKEYVLREEDYRVQIDPSFFEDKDPIEQPAMVTGYLERKKIEEAAAKAQKREAEAMQASGEHSAEEKQKELDQAMAKLNELQKEIERLKKQE